MKKVTNAYFSFITPSWEDILKAYDEMKEGDVTMVCWPKRSGTTILDYNIFCFAWGEPVKYLYDKFIQNK